VPGSGKTTFGQNLFNFKNKHVREVYEEFEYREKEYMLDMVTLYIDLEKSAEYLPYAKTLYELISLQLWVTGIELFRAPDGVSPEDMKERAILVWKRAKLNVLSTNWLLVEIAKRPMFILITWNIFQAINLI
jgi:hypothetical protein